MRGIQARVKAILDEATGQDLNSWEKNFLGSLKDRGNTTVSEKQETCLKKIEVKLGIDEEEEPEYPDDYRPLPGFSLGLDDDIPF